MTGYELGIWLDTLGLSQADFRRVLEYLSGPPIGGARPRCYQSTVSRWIALGNGQVPTPVAALIGLWHRLPDKQRGAILAAAGDVDQVTPRRRPPSRQSTA